MEPCPEIETLAALAEGKIGLGHDALIAHLDRCGDCRRVVAAAAAADETGDDERASVDSTRTGPRIGRFVVRRILGEGAMGIVHLAYDPELKRNVALKVIKPDSGDQLAPERLLVEAQTAAQLSHNNTVTIYDVGMHEGQPYVAMEYVEGTTVADWLRTGAVWREALSVMLAAGDGLAAAHRAGLVHRDFKPANVLLGSDGVVKVSDFGLARFADERQVSIAAHEEALALPPSTRASTNTGVLVGTPGYTSPEQFAGAMATASSDQFAFGVALYRALYGVRPFRGPTLYAVYEAIVNDPPPPPPRDARVPLALWPIIERALAKRPEERFATMTELLDALREASGIDSASVAPERCPFPGLVSFAEADARLFFGRSSELNEVLGKLRDQASVAVVGPSGAGKSSFLRALAIPALRREDPNRDVLSMRPGARPLHTLARLIAPLLHDDATRSVDDVVAWLRTDPSRLATGLSGHVRSFDSALVLHVDQLEELYTQCPERDDRLAFARAIASVGADPSRPMRLALTLRSDFLDRVAECRELMACITAGFVFLGPPGLTTLVHALTGPLAAVGYELEDPAIADEIARELVDRPGAFPLLQFVGGRLWDARDSARRTVTRASLETIGSVSGALARHADLVIGQLDTGDVHIARQILLRLVTADRTRLALPVRDLQRLGSAQDVERIVDMFVRGRLLVADADTVELIHEALTVAWPTLRRWLDDEVGDARLLADLAASARRWDAAKRPDGMLWTGEPARQALALASRGSAMTELEAAFVGATGRIARRAGRRRRIAGVAVVAVLATIAVIASAGYLRVRDSEQRATVAAERARDAMNRANTELAEKKQAIADKDTKARELEATLAALERQAHELRATTERLESSLAAIQTANQRVKKSEQEKQASKTIASKAEQKAASSQKEADDSRKALEAAKAAADQAKAARWTELPERKSPAVRQDE